MNPDGPFNHLAGYGFTAVVYSGEDNKRHVIMKRKKVQRTGARAQAPPWVRASISFPSDLYETLDAIAQQKKVSLAWVVRDAAERYVEGRSRMDDGQAPRT